MFSLKLSKDMHKSKYKKSLYAYNINNKSRLKKVNGLSSKKE